jgi:hypothetical protein
MYVPGPVGMWGGGVDTRMISMKNPQIKKVFKKNPKIKKSPDPRDSENPYPKISLDFLYPMRDNREVI